MNASTGTSKRALLGASLIVTGFIVAAPLARADDTVVVTLADKGLDSMRMDLSTKQIRAGKETFNVINTSQNNLVHEFVVAKSDKPIEALLYKEDENELAEDALAVMNEIDDIEPGKSGTLTVNLEPGSYVLFCNKTGHFKAGMVNQLTVIK